MSKLIEKFGNVELDLSECAYIYIGEEASIKCELISDDFAVKFMRWCRANQSLAELNKYSDSELLQIFKDEYYE